jgi:hypothetical protein
MATCRTDTGGYNIVNDAFPNGGAGVVNAKSHFQLQGDVIFVVLGMIR